MIWERLEAGRKTLVRAVAAGLWCGVFAILVTDHAPLRDAATAGLIGWLVLSLPDMRRLSLALFAGIWGLIGVLAWADQDASRTWDGLTFALVFVGFMPVAQLMRACIEALPSIGAAQARFGDMPGPERLRGLEFAGHLLGSVLLIGAYPILRPFLGADPAAADRLAAARAAARGVSLILLWSPFTVCMAFLSQQFPDVPIIRVVAVGAVLTVFAETLSLILNPTAGTGLGDRIAGVLDARTLASVMAMFAPVLVPLAVAIATVLTIASATPLTTLETVVVVVPFMCVAWLVVANRSAVGTVAAKCWIGLGNMANELLLFASALAFGAMLRGSPTVEALVDAALPAALPAPAALAAMIVASIFLGLMGLHPIVSASVLLGLFTHAAGGLTDLVMMVALTYAWMAAALTSVTSLAVLGAANTFDVPSERLAFGPNLILVILIGAVVFAVLWPLNGWLTGNL